jgi:hypothetical protein
MKIKFILFLVFATSASIILSSYRIGAANNAGIDATGAEGTGPLTNGGVGAVGCSTGSTCHNATASLNTIVELDSAGSPVTSYIPGGSYTVKITATNNTVNNLPVFGFQLATVLATTGGTNSAAQAGTWDSTSLPAHVQYVKGGGTGSGLNIPVVEHSDTLSATSGTGGAGTTYGVSIPWTAPVTGTGSIKVYGIINGSSGHDIANQNYYQAATAITIAEGVSHVGIYEIPSQLSSFNVYPTLMNDNVIISFDLKDAAAVNITLISMQGQTVKTLITQESLGTGSIKRSFDVNGLASGIYFVRLQIGNSSIVSKVVKE